MFDFPFIVAATIDPLKIALAVYYVFRPVEWPKVIFFAAVVATSESVIAASGPGSYSFFEWLPLNLITAILVAWAGNWFGLKRKAKGDLG